MYGKAAENTGIQDGVEKTVQNKNPQQNAVLGKGVRGMSKRQSGEHFSSWF